MNTKSFVNQFDDDNVVKGYYDADDQLVMVEPEGSGGGGPVSSFNVTVVNNSKSAFVLHAFVADVEADTITSEDAGASAASGATKTFLVVSLDGHATIGVENTNITVEGPHTETSDGEYKITGDVTITVAGA